MGGRHPRFGDSGDRGARGARRRLRARAAQTVAVAEAGKKKCLGRNFGDEAEMGENPAQWGQRRGRGGKMEEVSTELQSRFVRQKAIVSGRE